MNMTIGMLGRLFVRHSWSICQGLIPSKYHLSPFILELDLRAQTLQFLGSLIHGHDKISFKAYTIVEGYRGLDSSCHI